MFDATNPERLMYAVTDVDGMYAEGFKENGRVMPTGTFSPDVNDARKFKTWEGARRFISRLKAMYGRGETFNLVELNDDGVREAEASMGA